jgi:ribosomal protein S12 methylthiotransferase accessory factor
MRGDNPSLSWIATDEDRSKVRLPGTDRAHEPTATLEMAGRVAATVGVTRVADITRLDTIGIPTYQAIRPLSRTLAVSQGKGVTPELAKLSAIMESVETWHVEQPIAPLAVGPAAALGDGLGYEVTALPRCVPSVLHDRLPLRWTAARSLVDGSATVVPVDVVRLSLEQPAAWEAPAFFASTNGLASGNTRVEAALHALYEVVERDAVTAALGGREMGVPVDPGTAGSSTVDSLCAAIGRAGVRLAVRFVPSPTDLPCFLAWLACDDYPGAMFGFGCHLSTEIALTRAITEAAQTRLAYVAGARDDLHGQIEEPGTRRRPDQADPAADIADVVPAPVHHDSLLADLEHVVKRATAAFGHPPLLVDLTREELGVPVVKVVAPGSRVCPEVM